MSNTRCCVPGCVNNKAGVMEILHKFPNPEKNKELFNTWVYSVGGDILQLENAHIFKYRRVCHIHFEQKYWCRNNRLSNIALPTLSMPGLSISKFRSEGRVLRTIQASEPSTSREPVPPLVYLQGTVDIEMKENLDPRTQSQNIEKQLQCQNVTEDIEMKENTENAVTPSHSYSTMQLPAPRTTDLLIKKKNGSCKQTVHKQRLKRIAVTPAEHALYKRLTRVGIKLSKCQSKIRTQAMKIKSLQNVMTNPQFLKTLDNFPSTSKMFTLLQFREHKKGVKGRRFTMKEKIMALSMMKQSPKGYRFFRKIFILPSRQTLLKVLNMANINAGINKNIMEQIKKSTEKMNPLHRLCIVLFDEMSIKPSVQYNERKDRVSGFVTNGEEIYPEYANHAQVFMVRGVLKNYKQPVAYTFSQSATKGPELAKQLKTVIKELQNAGLIVIGTVCDQGTNNVQCIKMLINETKAYFLRKGEEPKENVIIINDHEIIPIYDPPHLIKCIRNNLITKNLQYMLHGQTKLAKWDHITALHKENPAYKGIQCIKKLTDAHCDPAKIPRMKVKFATQVFSQTVASNMGYFADKGILPVEAKDTADLLLFFDNLFDSVNGSHGKRKAHSKPLLGPAKPNSNHKKTWREAKLVLKNMKFINRSTNKNEYVPSINNWVWTLEGIELMLNILNVKYGVTSVWLRHLNQDPIENFFGSIRSHGCRNVNPTPDRFEAAYTTLLVNSLSSVHAPGANCEIDDCHIMLNEVLITSGGCKEQAKCELHIPDINITPLEDKKDPREIGGLQYVAGYFLKNAKEKVFKGCVQCKKDLINKLQPEYITYREYANKQWLCSPSDSLLNCISNLQDINYTIIKENLEKPHLKELIKTYVFMCIDFDFITCREHNDKIIQFLLKISCRFFIYNYCKEINNILSNRRECDDDSDMFKLKAKKLYKKCFKRKK